MLGEKSSDEALSDHLTKFKVETIIHILDTTSNYLN